MTQATDLTLDQMMALANQAAETGEDMTEGKEGGAGSLPVGQAMARLIRVVELGSHSQKDFNTKKHKGYEKEVQLTFALWGTGRDKETGETVTFHNPDTGAPRIWTPFDLVLSRNTGSNAFRMFKQMNWRNDKKNFAQMLNSTFILPFTLQDKSKTDKTQVVKLNIDGISPPLNPMDQTPLNVPLVPTEDLRLFLFDFPNKQQWDLLYVEGEWPAKGDKPAQSKNKTQQKIMAANNFKGSPLEIMLAGGGAALPDLTVPAAAPAAAVAPTPAQVAAVGGVPTAAVPVAAPLAVPTAAVAAGPAAAPAGIPATAIPAVPQLAVPSNPALPV